MHLPVALSFFISPVKPCFKPTFLLFLMTYLKQWYEFYILCVFLRLPVCNCHTYSAFHGVYTESGCLRFVLNILCFLVLIHELVIRVSFFTDTGTIPCISTSCSIDRGVIHEIGWKKFKRPGHVNMILGIHCSFL